LSGNNESIIEYPHYDIARKDNRKTILLLHGIGVNRKIWTPQMIALFHGYRLIVPDLLGHDRRSNKQFTFKKALHSLNAILDETSSDTVLLAGFSLGGYLASEFAAHCPEKTCGLVLIGASAIPKGLVCVPYHILAFLYRLIDSKWLERRDIRRWRARYGAEIAEPVIKSGFYHSVVPSLEKEIQGRDFLTGLTTYSKPVLIMNGEKDLLFRKDENLYHKSIPDSRLITIENAGHICNIEARESFNHHLLQFAGSLDWGE